MYPFLKIGNLLLPMYGVCIAIGIVLALYLAVIDCQRKDLQWEYMLAMASPGLLAGMIGAKLLYLLVTCTPHELLSVLKNGDVTGLIRGGFVFYGGFVTGILVVVLMSKIIKCRLSDYESTLVKCVPLAHAFGRIGCFFAGCCYGCPTKSFMGVVFSNPLGSAPVGVPLLPVQLFECAFNLCLTALLWWIDIRKAKSNIILPLYLMLYATERFVIEYFRFDTERGALFGVSTSQWISVAVFLVGIVILFYRKRRTAKC